MSDFDKLEDRELYELLDDAVLAERLEKDDNWKLLRKAAERIVDRALNEFALRTDPKDIAKIITLQTVVKKYKYGLFDEVKALRLKSEFAFQEAKERGLIGSFITSVKEKVMK